MKGKHSHPFSVVGMVPMGFSSSMPSTSFCSPLPYPNVQHHSNICSTFTGASPSLRCCSTRVSPKIVVLCKASQAVELFHSVDNTPEVSVGDVRLQDCWEVAETHCSSFFPNYPFPWDLLLRINRFLGLLSGFPVPSGCKRSVFVAKSDCEISAVIGILTLDTVADFLPRKGPQLKRRTGIAYISNVAVRKAHRRKGIAKRLIAEAEARACCWGCRSVALHCDANDSVAISLYKGMNFKTVKVPDHANWPTPRASPQTQFRFMIKLVNPDPTSYCESIRGK